MESVDWGPLIGALVPLAAVVLFLGAWLYERRKEGK
jgi:hypothetical protein